MNVVFAHGSIIQAVKSCSMTLAPKWNRRHIGVVFQECKLFNVTIRESIAFGLNYRVEEDGDSDEVVPIDAIIDAARQVNA